MNQDRPKNPPLLNLSLAGAFWVYGVMLLYFPDYAKVSSPWSWPFILLAYGFFLFSIAGTMFSLSDITRSEFIRYAGPGLSTFFVAFLLHYWSEWQSLTGWIVFVLKLLALAAAMLTVAFFAMGIPHLLQKQTSGLTNHADDTTVTTVKKSRFEQVASILIAALSLLTALVPLIKAWLNI